MKPPIKTLAIDFPDDGTGKASGCYVVVNGERIAQRGEPDSPHAGTWIPLEPGWAVYSAPGHEHIEITYDGVRVN
jgi:hypothetical protein